MLVSELIAELQKYQAANGDIEVRYSRTDDEGFPEGGSVDVNGVMEAYDDETDELGDDTGDFCLIY